MGKFLHKLGHYSYQHKWRVLIIWLVLLAGLGGLAATQYKPMSNAISIPGTEAQQSLERFDELFPDAGEGSARIVLHSQKGTLDSHKKTINDLNKSIAKIDGVAQVVSPFDNPTALSSDKKIAYSQVQLDHGMGEVSEDTTESIARAVADHRSSSLQIEIGGDAINQVPGEIIGVGEIVGVVIALGVLVVTLGALVAAGLPIIIALMTIGAGTAGLFGLSQVVDITSTTPVLGIMLGLAVGIDYSLFIISKYKHYLLAGYGYSEAAAKAIATAGNAVLFAAATVVIALSALTVVGIPFMTTMGLAGASTVALAAIIAVTFIPALLGMVRTRIFAGKTRRAIEAAQAKGPQAEQHVSHNTFWYRWGEKLTKHPVIVLVAAVIVVGAISLPARSLTLGLPTDEFASTQSTERKAYDLLAQGFGDGFNGPLLVVAENVPQVSQQDKQKIRDNIEGEYQKEVAKQRAAQEAKFRQQAAQVTTPAEGQALQQQIAKAQADGRQQQQAAQVEVEKQIQQYTEVYQLNKISEKIADIDGVKTALPAQVTDSGRQGIIQVIPTTSPSSEATHDLVNNLRDPSTQNKLGDNISLGITGSAALQMDVNEKLAQALPVYLMVVVGLSLVLLIVAFRSILVPIKATLGFLLSVFAMFGALVAVFQWGWFGISDAPGPIVSFIPIISIGVLFGLAMDYEFFLVSSMHEEYHRTKNAKKAIVGGFGLGSKVVTAAGVIMVAVFAGFISNADSTIQAIGFGLAVGIFVDAFIVRMTIVPAVMTLLGKAAWWLPKWLDKRLPHISIEGEED
ncbi:MAG: MMPL family transporter [bacterium]|nr:MMPL family transporter [bacterium]